MRFGPVLIAEHPFRGHVETSYSELGLVTDAGGLQGDLAEVASEVLWCPESLVARGHLGLRVFLWPGR